MLSLLNSVLYGKGLAGWESGQTHKYSVCVSLGTRLPGCLLPIHTGPSYYRPDGNILNTVGSKQGFAKIRRQGEDLFRLIECSAEGYIPAPAQNTKQMQAL